MYLSVNDACKFVCGNLSKKTDAYITSVTTDTREINEGCLFVALKGEKFDGHDYIKEAVKKGATAVMAQKNADELKVSVPVISVDDTYKALLLLAGGYRKSMNVKVIGVTGSVGKTTTKDMIAAVLSQGFCTKKTVANFNNHIGVPKTVFSIDDSTEAAVIEMGMNHFGEISALTLSALPDVAVITCIGVSHIENLGSRENILKAKLEILEGMKPSAPVIINADNDLLGKITDLGEHKVIRVSCEENPADVEAKDICENENGISFSAYVCGRLYAKIKLPVLGKHNVNNALLAVAVGHYLGIDGQKVSNGLESYTPSGMRQKIEKKCGMTFIEDCYNASPTSVLASLSVLEKINAERHIAVLGDMLELGEYAERGHREVGESAGKICDTVVCCGELSKSICEEARKQNCKAFWFENRTLASEFLKKELKEGDCVLFKASHSMKFEEIITYIYDNLSDR